MKNLLLSLGVLSLCACSMPLVLEDPVISSVALKEAVSEGDVTCIVEGEYPHISGLASVQVALNINSYFDEFAYGLREDIRHCPTGTGTLLDTTQVSFTVTRLDKQYLSVALLASQFTQGAAHPRNSIETFVFDMSTGQPITLSNLFVASTDYSATLEEYVQRKAAEEYLGDYPSDTTNPIAKFYLTEDSIVLVDLFTIHATQAFEVEILFEELSGLLKE